MLLGGEKKKKKNEAIDLKNLHFPMRAPKVAYRSLTAEERAQGGFKSSPKGRT